MNCSRTETPGIVAQRLAKIQDGNELGRRRTCDRGFRSQCRLNWEKPSNTSLLDSWPRSQPDWRPGRGSEPRSKVSNMRADISAVCTWQHRASGPSRSRASSEWELLWTSGRRWMSILSLDGASGVCLCAACKTYLATRYQAQSSSSLPTVASRPGVACFQKGAHFVCPVSFSGRSVSRPWKSVWNLFVLSIQRGFAGCANRPWLFVVSPILSQKKCGPPRKTCQDIEHEKLGPVGKEVLS